ncbi:MAG: PilZ domain-containing protein [Hyphomicrobiales bacterium]|nr:PilZ domain-containing protein [Hyphomicrobiales bacterium]
MRMSKERRRAPRRKVDAPAFLYSGDGRPLGACRMKDISSGGARLAHAITAELPDDLVLWFSRDGAVRRRCQLAWRTEKQLGVRFLTLEPARESHDAAGRPVFAGMAAD